MLKNITKNLQPAIGLTLGSVASGMAAKLIPVGDDRIKNAITLLGGLILMGTGKGKNAMLGHVGAGIVAGSGARIAAGFGLGEIALSGPDIDFDIEDLNGPGGHDPVSGAEGANDDISM